MAKSSPKAPPAPDPAVTSALQTQSNVDTARTNANLNRVNQYGPQGSITYSNPGGDTWDMTTRLSPDQQRLYDQSTAGQQKYGDAALSQLDKLGGILSKPIDFNSAPAAGSAYQPGAGLSPTLTPDAYGAINPNIGYGAESRNRVETALQGRLQPVQDAQRSRMETGLRNQGLVPGTEAWTNAQRDLGMQENDARLGIISQGGQEEALQAQIADALYGQQAQNKDRMFQGQQALFGQQQAARSQGAQEQSQQFTQQQALHGQGVQEMQAQRQIPLNEIAALLGGQQVNYPTYQNSPTATVAPTDVIGAYGNAAQANNARYAAQSQSAASGNAGLASLLGTGIFAGLSGGAGGFGASAIGSLFGKK